MPWPSQGARQAREVRPSRLSSRPPGTIARPGHTPLLSSAPEVRITRDPGAGQALHRADSLRTRVGFCLTLYNGGSQDVGRALSARPMGCASSRIRSQTVPGELLCSKQPASSAQGLVTDEVLCSRGPAEPTACITAACPACGAQRDPVPIYRACWGHCQLHSLVGPR